MCTPLSHLALWLKVNGLSCRGMPSSWGVSAAAQCPPFRRSVHPPSLNAALSETRCPLSFSGSHWFQALGSQSDPPLPDRRPQVCRCISHRLRVWCHSEIWRSWFVHAGRRSYRAKVNTPLAQIIVDYRGEIKYDCGQNWSVSMTSVTKHASLSKHTFYILVHCVA